MNAAWLRAALLGLLAWWIVGVVRPPTDDLSAIGRVLDLFLLALTPLVLGLDPRQPERGVVLPAALVAVASGQVPTPWLAAVWPLLGAGLLAGWARRWATRPRSGDLALDGAARAFLLVGGGWLVIDRAGLQFLGLSAEQIRLAAIHSHFIGFGVLTLAAASARRRARADQPTRPLVVAGVALVVAFALIANGIAFLHPLEPLGAVVLLGALAAIVGLDLSGPRVPSLARALRGLSLLALAAGFGLALTYSLRGLPGLPTLTRAEMIRLHGWTLGVGFLLPAVLAQALATRGARAASPTPPLLLFDGECGLCDQTVQTLLKLDPEGPLRFAPLQGETADPILDRAGITARDDFDSILLVRDPGGPRERVFTEFAGARAVLQSLASPRYQGLGRLLRLIPGWLGDAGYRLVAKNRMRIWGKADACRIPTPAERARVLP